MREGSAGHPQSSERIEVAGLSAPAEILVDRWGIPHLSAESLHDLFFLQGFNAARDRLWQIDLWRKRGLGLLAADFGPGYLAQDAASRLFLYSGDMAAEWAAYGEDAEEICTAFVAGINAYVALTEREPSRLPDEFRAMGTRPARWQAEDVVRIRTHGLTRNALSELERAQVLAHADAATDLLRKDLAPREAVRLPDRAELPVLPADALDLFKLATAPVNFSPERLAVRLEDADSWAFVNERGEVVRDPTAPAEDRPEGSNNWAVHGSRTDTGRPILASDPHRAHALPSLRYLVHLAAPGFDAIGAGEPSVPGIMVGHNGEIAFSLTIFGADQEDVYIYDLRPEDSGHYRYGDGWEAVEVRRERFAVRGAADQERLLKFTRHGPVVHEDVEGRRAVAIRTVWSQPGAAPYLASLRAMRARDFAGFREALRHWGTPSVNQVYADVRGTIAWLPAGAMPLRPNWQGLLPVPGDGSHEWDGFLDPGDLPCIVNPEKGYVATANEMNLPAGWPHESRPIGFEWTEGSRAERINEVLRADRRHALAGSCALQTDVVSIPARRLLRLVERLDAGAHADLSQALTLLQGWDARLDAGSAPAALVELWWTRHLKPAVFARLAPDPEVRKWLAPGDVAGILAALEAPDASFGPAPERARDALLAETLAAAFRDARARLGDEPAAWRWGDLHNGYFAHPLTGSATEQPAIRDIGPLPKGGSASTPMHAGYRPDDFRVTHGASVRLVIDVGDWDRSLCINAPGQSGDGRSLHYADLAPLWARGDYVPLLYSREAIEDAAEMRIALVPAA